MPNPSTTSRMVQSQFFNSKSGLDLVLLDLVFFNPREKKKQPILPYLHNVGRGGGIREKRWIHAFPRMKCCLVQDLNSISDSISYDD